MHYIRICLLFTWLFTGTRAFSQESLQADTDITYKTSPAGKDLKLDIFLPKTTGPFPVMMIIHGGAWVLGNKSLDSIYLMRQLRQGLLDSGIAVVSINYSLVSDSVHFPRPIEDCKDAIRWLFSQAATYQLDTTRFGLWGGSAGAHLALLAGYTASDQWQGAPELTGQPTRINYVVDYFGPTDLNKLLRTRAGFLTEFITGLISKKLLPLRKRLIKGLTGYELKTDKAAVLAACTEFSPLEYTGSHAVPTLIFHGTRDWVVPMNQTRRLRRQLRRHKVEHGFIKVKKGDHGFNNIAETRLDQLVDQTIDFVMAHSR